MKTLVFGGAFDPPHIGHRQLLAEAIKLTGADKVLVIPTPYPPHKSAVTTFDDRFEMAKLAFSDIAEVSDMEKNNCPSYSYLTLEKLKESGDDLFFAIGGDSVNSFHKWCEPQKVARAATIVAVKRGGENIDEGVKRITKDFGGTVLQAEVKVTEISSGELRLLLNFENALGACENLTDCKSTDYIDDKVGKYIKDNGIYSRYVPYIDKLSRAVKESRLRHTFFVAKAGLDFVKKEKVDEDQALTACLLHDCAKYMVDRCEEYGIPENRYDKSVAHAFLGAAVAKKDYGITDEKILSAIASHTTGKGNMSPLDKLVYTADFIEPTRGHFADSAREAARLFGLNESFKATLLFTYLYLCKGDVGEDNICAETKDAFLYYMKEDKLVKTAYEKGSAEEYLKLLKAERFLRSF